MTEPAPDAPKPADPVVDPAPAETDPNSAETGKDGAEAAKYRRRLRETETQRDQLSTRVERMQRADVERLAGAHLAKGADVMAFGTDLADLLGDDGEVDPDKVTAAALALLEDRPGLHKDGRPRRGPTSLGQGSYPGVGTPPKTWASVIRGG